MPDNEYLDAPDAGWEAGEFAPVREHCRECGVLMPRTHKRDAFGGRGRLRETCSAACRQRASRRRRAAANAERRREQIAEAAKERIEAERRAKFEARKGSGRRRRR